MAPSEGAEASERLVMQLQTAWTRAKESWDPAAVEDFEQSSIRPFLSALEGLVEADEEFARQLDELERGFGYSAHAMSDA